MDVTQDPHAAVDEARTFKMLPLFTSPAPWQGQQEAGLSWALLLPVYSQAFPFPVGLLTRSLQQDS